MKCKQMRELIFRHVDGRLDPDEKVSFDLHIRSCAACRKVLEENLVVHDLFSSAERYSAPYGFTTRVMARARVKDKESSRFLSFPHRRFFLPAVEVAFALIVLLIGLISGTALVTERPIPRTDANVEQSLSLELFEAAPPDSIAGVYITMVRGEK